MFDNRFAYYDAGKMKIRAGVNSTVLAGAQSSLASEAGLSIKVIDVPYGHPESSITPEMLSDQRKIPFRAFIINGVAARAQDLALDLFLAGLPNDKIIYLQGTEEITPDLKDAGIRRIRATGANGYLNQEDAAAVVNALLEMTGRK